jgi:hypothetical protein
VQRRWLCAAVGPAQLAETRDFGDVNFHPSSRLLVVPRGECSSQYNSESLSSLVLDATGGCAGDRGKTQPRRARSMMI